MQTARHEVAFDVSADGALLLGPALPELGGLLGRRMPPPVLLSRLRQAGLNLSPSEADAAQLPAGLLPKEPALEEEAASELLLLSASFRLAASKWNGSRDQGKACVRVGTSLPQVRTAAARPPPARAASPLLTPAAPRACARAARASQEEEDDGELLPSAQERPVDHFAGTAEHGWETVLYAHRYAALLQSGEADAHIALDVHGMEQLARGHVAHGSAVSCFKARHPGLALDLASASAHYMRVLHQLFAQMRLLSFTAGEVAASDS